MWQIDEVVGKAIFALLLFSLTSFADQIVEVGFLELRHWNGSLRLLEPDFRFAHVAVKIDGKWLHAHPARGVEYVEEAELEKVGKIGLVIRTAVPHQISAKSVSLYIGKPYDLDFSWEEGSYYCSELVAKILGISPVPMHFDPALWPEKYLQLEGNPGISPGLVYRALASPALTCAHGLIR